MSIIYVMIPLALVLVALAVWAMVWAIRSGQFDELESHGWTPVLDDDERPGSSADDPEEPTKETTSRDPG
jgi:cbb3-type cytochrome oxidase maturation protein